MRYVSKNPAQQLRSVAARYCRTGTRFWPLESRHSWRDRQLTRRNGMAVDSGDLIARRQRVEAVLLLSREPMNSRKLAQYARLSDGTEARTIVRGLNQLYDDTGRSFRVEELAGGYQLLTRSRFAPWLRRLEHVPRQVRLSAPAMETLAVVAYRQPVLRADIEAIRGVNCGEILRQLMERDLVRIGGRSEELGRPYLYTTTKRFLQLFGLQNLDSLPCATALRDDSVCIDPVHLGTPQGAADEAQQEQEKSEVTVTSPTQLPVDELLEEMPSKTLTPQGSYDSDDEYDGDDDFEFEDDDEDDDEDEFDTDEEEDVDEDSDDVDDVDDEDYDDEYEDDDEDDVEDDVEDDEDDEDDDEDDEDGFEEDEWEEVEDDDEEGDWDEEDEDWDDDYEEDEDEDEDDEYEYDEEEEEEEDDDWE